MPFTENLAYLLVITDLKHAILCSWQYKLIDFILFWMFVSKHMVVASRDALHSMSSNCFILSLITRQAN